VITNNGQRTVTFRDGGTNALIGTATATMELNHEYTAVGFGDPGSETVALLSDFSVVDPGKAAVRIINATGQNAVDVYLGDAGQTVDQALKIDDDLANGASMAYRNTTIGDRKIFVTNANDMTVLAQQDVTLHPTHHYTLVIAHNTATTILVVPED
jgi:hypothetical protein